MNYHAPVYQVLHAMNSHGTCIQWCVRLYGAESVHRYSAESVAAAHKVVHAMNFRSTYIKWGMRRIGAESDEAAHK